MKLMTALLIALSMMLTSSVFADDGDAKKPEKGEKGDRPEKGEKGDRPERKKKREMPEELRNLRMDLMKKVEAGELTKEQAKEKFIAAAKEYRAKNGGGEKDGERKKGDREKDGDRKKGERERDGDKKKGDREKDGDKKKEVERD